MGRKLWTIPKRMSVIAKKKSVYLQMPRMGQTKLSGLVYPETITSVLGYMYDIFSDKPILREEKQIHMH